MLTKRRGSGAPSENWPDLSGCDWEPIHIPSSIQPHGVLFVLDEDDHTVVQVSENVGQLLGVPLSESLGGSIDALLGEIIAEKLTVIFGRPRRDITTPHGKRADGPTRSQNAYLGTIPVDVRGSRFVFYAAAHRAAEGIVLELELRDEPPEPGVTHSSVDVHPLLDTFTLRAEAATTIDELCRFTAEELRRLTGFDRVLIYRFDKQWNGTVIGEDGNGRLPSYLDHRFPASDIPAQARELYRRNRLRMIPDAYYEPVSVLPATHPATGKPLDMSFSILRSVSPVHVRYMQNMQTAASMSVSILRDGELWGLISCHHHQPKTIPFPIRGTCDLFARAFSLRLSAVEHLQDHERRLQVRSAYSALLAGLAEQNDFATALVQQPQVLMSFTGATGAAVLTDQECLLVGTTPGEQAVRDIAGWLFRRVDEEVFETDSLAAAWPAAVAYKDNASGLLAIAVSKLRPSYVMWFRPEVIQTIKWGGDPHKPTQSPHEDAGAPHDDVGGQAGAGQRTTGQVVPGHPLALHPRKSFQTWQETVRQKALPWEPSEVEAAVDLRNTIVGTVLRKAEELAELTAELSRSNKELEAFSYSVSHDLRAPLRHIVGYAEMLNDSVGSKLSERDRRCITTIIESSEYAGQLVDKLLGYSRLGRAELQLSGVDLNRLVAEVRQDVMLDAADRQIIWNVAELPSVSADLMMLRMAIRDLVSNAVKYTRHKDEAVIEIGSHIEGPEMTFWIKDNGVGFDMQYADKLFGVFQRLHRWEDYEGTGIGLANVRRVIERHGGRTWAQATEGNGATFFFSLPMQPESEGMLSQNA